MVKSVTWQPVSCWSDPLFTFWYIRKPDALHGCSQDYSHETETETLYLQERDETETLNPQDRDETETYDFSKLSRPRRSTFKTETRRSKKRLQTALRPRLHPCRRLNAYTFTRTIIECYRQQRMIVSTILHTDRHTLSTSYSRIMQQ